MSFFFFKQKTAYEMRISDWSSDVCSSDLRSRAHARAMTDVIIYHNPACGTSRNTLAMIRNAGIEPHVVEYLKTPLVRALLVELIARAGLTPRSEEHTSELQSLMRISYAVFCLKKKKTTTHKTNNIYKETVTKLKIQ